MLNFSSDIYCTTFIKFMTSNDAILHRELMLKCALTFIFQILLIQLVAFEKPIEVYQGDVKINLARFVCAIILHIQIIPEVFCALNLMRFVSHNESGFYGKHSQFPFLLGFMKFLAGLTTEITNVLIIIQSTDIESVIKDFIAFGFIVEIDDLMISTVTSINCEEVIGNSGIGYPKKQPL